MARRKSKEESGNKIEELAKQVNHLSSEERAEFFKRIGGIDSIEYLGGEIRIDDWQGMDRKWPRATIRYHDESEKNIDIIKTVRENATSIGHPLILHAIRRWERLVLYHSALSGGGQYKTSDIDFYRIAKTHLENIGKALIEGVRNRAIAKEFAPYIRRALGTDMDYVYLQRAWEMLADSEIKYKRFGEGVRKQRSPGDKRRLIAKKLRIALANWIHLNGASVLRLQGSIAHQEVISGKMKYGNLRPHLLLKDPAGNVMSIDPESRMSRSQDLSQFQVRVKPPDGPITWVKLSELIQNSDSKVEPENSMFKIADLITAANFRIPRQGPTERERKLAALMGLREFVPIVVNNTGESSSRQVYEGREIHFDNYIESMSKKKLDLVIEFLKSEKGERFLKTRPSWIVFFNVFDAWRFGYNKNTLRQYRSMAKKQVETRERLEGKDWLGIDGTYVPAPWLDGQFLLPDFINEYPARDIDDWQSLPTVAADRSQ
jgi:hypothetical protein